MRYELKIDKDASEIDVAEYARLLQELLGPGVKVVEVRNEPEEICLIDYIEGGERL